MKTGSEVTKELLAYLMSAGIVVTMTTWVFRARYYSRKQRVARKQRAADRAELRLQNSLSHQRLQ